jgi:glyoxylase-like metal-dependent hydrolase (beta-lactamase superfamily II)
MIMQSRMLGAARISRVLEYSGPTHAPDFLFPGEDRAVFTANAGWLAPHHYVPAMQRLIVSVQLWVLHAGGNVILIDTGVGSRKPRQAERMNMLNTLVLPWLEAAGAGPEQVTHVVLTHLHADHVGWNTVLADGRWVPTFPRALHFPQGRFSLLEGSARPRRERCKRRLVCRFRAAHPRGRIGRNVRWKARGRGPPAARASARA